MTTLWMLAYLGGFLTLLSPCILPVLPFVFSGADQPFKRSGLPLLAGMALTFAAISTFAVIGGGWAVQANEWGRWVAMALLSAFALTLIFPEWSEKAARPLTRLGETLQPKSDQVRGPGGFFLLGVATGFLWAPCAGPILGLILTGAALQTSAAGRALLLLAYALGAATALGAALAAGGRLLGLLKKYLAADRWVRRFLGTAILAGVLAILFGWDRGLLTRLARVQTETWEERLLNLWPGRPDPAPERDLPELRGATAWLNSPPLSREALRGKVVLIDFWTYSCINCLRALPYVTAWAEKYKPYGLVLIGVHAPEFAFERKESNVRKAVRDLRITYPVAIDNQYALWNAFSNQYWPAHYLADASGKIIYHHFGEGNYEKTERRIQSALTDAGAKNVPSDYVTVRAQGAQAPGLDQAVESPETYLGYSRSENGLLIPALRKDQEETYRVAGQLALNQWSLGGHWTVHTQAIHLEEAQGRLLFRFRARDLHLVMGPGPSGAPVRFTVRLDGRAPEQAHGTDIDASGNGVIQEHRLYQLIRQTGAAGDIRERTFEIEFFDTGAQAFAFTFG
jgi:cytochrome c biogenesis protein CcdA/thiol-disulfide isomerase/thioredoxin